MEKYFLKIISTEFITHNVKRFKVERPSGLIFLPGQAAHLSVNKTGWMDQVRPFTFTGLGQSNFLEFMIKIYPDHHGVTEQLEKLLAGDEIILHDIFGTIHYYNEGTFIAGGSGITPFIAILRELENENRLGNNTLLFSNTAEQDIILKEEFTRMLGTRFINTLTQQKTAYYDNRTIDEKYLHEKITNYDQYFYLCGPDKMVESIKQILITLGAKNARVIVEQF